MVSLKQWACDGLAVSYLVTQYERHELSGNVTALEVSGHDITESVENNSAGGATFQIGTAGTYLINKLGELLLVNIDESHLSRIAQGLVDSIGRRMNVELHVAQAPRLPCELLLTCRL